VRRKLECITFYDQIRIDLLINIVTCYLLLSNIGNIDINTETRFEFRYDARKNYRQVFVCLGHSR